MVMRDWQSKLDLSDKVFLFSLAPPLAPYLVMTAAAVGDSLCDEHDCHDDDKSDQAIGRRRPRIHDAPLTIVAR